MTEKEGAYIIRALRKKWITHSILSHLFFSAGFSLLFSIFLYKLSGIPLWSFAPVFIAIFLLLFLIQPSWKIKEATIARLLNQHYPQLEESSGLLLKDYFSLNRLEQLQYHKTAGALSAIPAPLQTRKNANRSLTAFFIMLLLGAVCYKIPFQVTQNPPAAITGAVTNKSKAEKILPGIENIFITVAPPAYTLKPLRQQHVFNLTVEAGSSVSWQLTTRLPVKALKLIFNDSLPVYLKPTDTSFRTWVFEKTFISPGFYQVDIDGNLSELYKIESLPDQPPVIRIISPGQYTTIDIGEPQKALTKIEMSDDYGIQEAYISATISSGSGEAVTFKEQKILFPEFTAGKKQYQLQKIISLPGLGMQAGDELYFFIKAIDNHQQESRSDIYIINLADTAGLMSLEGLANSVNIKPEYFRSQRQIIIETEQLLKDKDTIALETFKNRSNNLGIDQKMLRLRYGKFLGEEEEPGDIGSKDNDGLQDPANFSNAEKLKEAFTDQHDKAEDATFFEPAIKKQLKATLTEMWNAELPLRLFKPQDALPYEYKALRLLKDLQQKTRAYVAKTNLRTTPLDLQKRLTGDLVAVIQPRLQKDITPNDDPQNVMREALGILEQLRLTDTAKAGLQQALRPAGILLNEKARQQPSLYLPAVQAMHRIINALNAGTGITATDITITEKGFQKILSDPLHFPSAGKTNTGQQLSKQYFINLQHPQP